MEPQKMKDIFNPNDLEKKHTPVIERLGGDKVLVRVGIIPHVMEEAHYIESIELYCNKALIEKKGLKSGMSAEAEFTVVELKEEDVLMARETCNLHGLRESI